MRKTSIFTISQEEAIQLLSTQPSAAPPPQNHTGGFLLFTFFIAGCIIIENYERGTRFEKISNSF
jgi:hypothetical protein